MPRMFNAPKFRNDDGEHKIKRYVHSPLTIEHNGFKASIKSNGRITISGSARPIEGSPDEVEWDEIEIPASLIFKIGGLLKATRQVKYMTLAELQAGGKDSTAEVSSDE